MYEIKYGVSQSSVLGHILFILYINEICDFNIDGSIVTYADDTCLLFSHNTWEDVYEKFITGFWKVLQKLKGRNLSLNIEKTECIPFSINKSDSTVSSISMNALITRTVRKLMKF